ncbi:MAG: hypothetical protein PHE76_02780 [Candidatus Pacebacteria bacterium]|jgi:phage FluMu protein Com|nr:hypothetical protein [Candidatus Paceibacterota bacterium]NMB47540.1 hypothetical protein [Patescibacteria group bacterium]
MLKEYRCEYCNKLFFKGNIKEATIEVKCRYCKNMNLIKIATLLHRTSLNQSGRGGI